MAEWILDHPEVVLAIAVVPIASWLIHEFRRIYQQNKDQSETLNKRMDNADRKLDSHLREGIGVHRALERLETESKARGRELSNMARTLERLEEQTRKHHENGGRHGKSQ